MKTSEQIRTWGLALLVALGLAVPTSAQDQKANQDRPRDRPTQGSNAETIRRQQQQNSAGDTARGLQAVPEGWIRIGTDTDGDGQFDQVETIFVFDLEQARARSADRRGGGGGSSAHVAMSRPQGARAVTIEGKVRSLSTARLRGLDEAHQLGRVETAEGRTAKVDFGPRSQLGALNLKEGSEVTVTGSRGLINDRAVLMAHKVEAGEKSVEITWPHDRSYVRVRGEVVSTRTAKFRNKDGEHVIARVRLKGGEVVTAILGAKETVSELDIEKGKELTMLVHPGRINGRPALVADSIREGDQTIELEQHDKTRFQPKSPGSEGEE